MQFDGTVSLGSILAAASVILALWGFHTKNVDRWTALKTDIADMRRMVETLWARSGIEDGNGHGDRR